MNIPFMDLAQQYSSLQSEMDAAILKVVRETAFIGGEEIQKFERDFAASIGARHCIGVGNGTDAIYVALKAMGVGPGDEVVTVANTFIASAEAVTQTGARVVFVDCDPNTFNIDLDALERVLASREGKVKAVIPVHLYGRAVDMTSLMDIASRHRVQVLEDCAQAHYARHAGKAVGTIGQAGTFSFYPGKNLGAYGDAGAIVTNDDALARKMRMFANHGRLSKYDHEMEGINSRLDNLQAAVLNVKLKHIVEWTRMRQGVAREYGRQLAGIQGITLPEIPTDESHVYHLFVIRVKDRAAVQDKLKARGVTTGVHYPIALPNLKAYAYLSHKFSDFPVASRYQDEVLSLPIFPEMTPNQIKHVADSLRESLRS